MIDFKAGSRLSAILNASRRQGGIAKRLEENRATWAKLHRDLPHFMQANPEVIDWLCNLDDWLAGMAAAIGDEAAQALPPLQHHDQASDSNAALPLTRHAAYVQRSVHQSEFTVMLYAFEDEARQLGIHFETGTQESRLDPATKKRLGSAAIRARMNLISPSDTDATLEDYMNLIAQTGEPERCADSLLSALAELRIVPARRMRA